MDFFISEAYAQSAGQAGAPSPIFNILLLVGMFVVFYFILIRPQQRRVKEHKALVAALKKGDEVITSGGLLAKLTDVGEQFVRCLIGVQHLLDCLRNVELGVA